ncbi:MAG: PAS domain S-box protein [Alphaproteobacteria bacterium]
MAFDVGVDVEEEWDRAIRREQLAILIRQAPFLAIVNIVNALLLGVIVGGQVPVAIIWGWTGVVALGALYPLRTWWRSRSPEFRLSGSLRSIRRATVQAGLAGLTWAVAAPFFAFYVEPQTELFLYIVLSGMVAGGAVMLSSVPSAAIAFSAPIAGVVLFFVLLQADATFGALGVMLVLFFFVTNFASRSVFWAAVTALKGQAQETQRRQLTQHRFRDFAAAASDWFWESDRQHRLTEVTGIQDGGGARDNGRFSGLNLRELRPIDPGEADDLRAAIAAGDRLQNRHCVFHDAGGTRLEVAVNALPLRDAEGNFLGYRGTFADVSDIVAARRRVADAEATLRDAIEALDDGLIVYDETDRVVAYNAKHRALFPSLDDIMRPGVPYVEIVSTQIQRGQLDNAVGREEAAIAEQLRKHRDPGQPEIQHFADGRIIRLTEKRTASGGIVALRTDITDLVQARQRAEQSERNLLMLLESAPIPLWVTAHGRFMFANRRAHRLLGVEDDLLMGQSVAAYYDEPDADTAYIEHEARVRRADGSTVWVAVSAADVFYQGQTARITGLLDIADRKEAERRLKESEQRFRDFAASSGDWLWETDADLRFTYMSANVERIVGLPPEWHYGKTRRELLGESYDSSVWDDHLATLEAREPFRDFVYRRVGEGIEPNWLRTSGVPVFDEDGAFLGYRGVGSDVTEAREMQEQLVQAQKLESVGQLTGGIAHDFNNILGIIIGNLELVLVDLGGVGAPAERIEKAIGAAERGSSLTHRLLAFSRRQSLNSRALSLESLVKETSVLLERSLGRGHPLRIDMAANLWTVRADAAQLEAAIVNMAINARDASPEGSPIVIAAHNLSAADLAKLGRVELQPGDYVAVTVTDQGEGMPRDVLERCCEPFFTTKPVGRGTGLGLSMTVGFAKQSGGDLRIDSRVGQGTKVTLVLPRAVPAMAKAG